MFTDNEGRPRAGAIGVRDTPRPGSGPEMPPRQAHRIAYEFLVGPLTAEDMLIRMCETAACVNPGHYLKGTSQTLGEMYRSEVNQCGRGHEYTEQNTAFSPKGTRVCKACAALRRRADRRAQALGYVPVSPVVRRSQMCSQGHEVVGDNALFMPSSGLTICRACNNEGNRESRKRVATSA